MKVGRRWLIVATLAALGISGASAPTLAQTKPVLVFAAASLKNALDDINAQYAQESGKPKAAISYAASSTLAKQAEAGAPADIFISADLDWMDYLAQKNLIKPETRKTLLGNRLVLVAPAASAARVDVRPGFPLASLLQGGKLAMADTRAVPAGKYGQAALESLGVWSQVSGSVAQAENVRAALALVARGEAPYGIVYATDAASEPSVAVAGTFPESSHPPIVYPAALLKESSNPDAAAFLAYLESAKAKPLFEKQGFTVLK
ncbi:MAG: molybdate ABC transporter substrate-binding protein [Alphaproteobacteria bacterium]|nr:molybdate ABC transporter substrate-binding protein [Alphaproteobacteria bacterium]